MTFANVKSSESRAEGLTRLPVGGSDQIGPRRIRPATSPS